jgi:quercetin dioxygenase-like cupin family protein
MNDLKVIERNYNLLAEQMFESPDHFVELPLKHLFAPGVYYREITMPKGKVVLGKKHKTTHFNIVLTGHVTVCIGDELADLIAPCVFISEAGVQKLLYMHEETRWATIHPTDETNIEKLEELLVEDLPFELQQKIKTEKEQKCLSYL